MPGGGCFACGEPMRRFFWGSMCEPCEILELGDETRTRPESYIDADTGEEVPYIDHSREHWPSPA